MDCIYEDCDSKRIQFKGRYVLKSGEVRLRFKCEKCEQPFDDRLIPGKSRNKFDPKVINYMMELFRGDKKVKGLEKGSRLTSSIIRKVLLKQSFKEGSKLLGIPLTSNIQSRMNRFMKKHGVSSLPLSPSSNYQ